MFCDFGHFGRVSMSREVHVYTIGGGGSIDWVPGVVLAAWGGPGRARGAVRVVPKTRNCITSRVKARRPSLLVEFLNGTLS